jgi:hypothetical protein
MHWLVNLDSVTLWFMLLLYGLCSVCLFSFMWWYTSSVLFAVSVPYTSACPSMFFEFTSSILFARLLTRILTFYFTIWVSCYPSFAHMCGLDDESFNACCFCIDDWGTICKLCLINLKPQSHCPDFNHEWPRLAWTQFLPRFFTNVHVHWTTTRGIGMCHNTLWRIHHTWTDTLTVAWMYFV